MAEASQKISGHWKTIVDTIEWNWKQRWPSMKSAKLQNYKNPSCAPSFYEDSIVQNKHLLDVTITEQKDGDLPQCLTSFWRLLVFTSLEGWLPFLQHPKD